MTETNPTTSRRKLLSGAPAALALAGAAAGGAVQAAAPAAPQTFYSTLDPEQQASFDRLFEIVKAQAEGRTIAPPPDPDAELLAACAEWHRLDGLAYLEGNDDWEAAHHESWRVADEIDGMCALTEAGHKAKAWIAVTQMDRNRCAGEFMGDRDARFAMNVLCDWLGLPA